MSQNQLTSVDMTGCIQITKLDLSYNKLESPAIDQILLQVEAFQTSRGLIDLRANHPPLPPEGPPWPDSNKEAGR